VTGAARATTLTRGTFELDTAAWGGWLRDRVDPAWRPGEWDAASWLFTGNPDNPATSTVRCRTVRCPALLPGRAVRFCQTCQSKLGESGLNAPEFVESHVPPPPRAAPGAARETCVVSRDGRRCTRPRFSKGLCQSHYGMWRAHRRRNERDGDLLDLPAWIRVFASPYTDPPPACLVGGCPATATTTHRLCGYHLRRWWQNGRPEIPRAWAVGQVPYLAGNQFSLRPLPELVRWEVLFCLQYADEPGRALQPRLVRHAAMELAAMTTLLDGEPRPADGIRWDKHVASQIGYLCWAVRVGFDEFRGVKPTEKSVFDLRLVGLAPDSPTARRRRQPGTADLRGIEQPWLRELLQRWVETEHPPARRFHQTLRAVQIASRALAERPGGGHDPTVLRFTDMSAVITAMWSQVKPDGTPYAANSGANWHAVWFKLLDIGGRAGLLDDLAASFVRDRTAHTTRRHLQPNEDELGKAVPEMVIAQLDAQLESLGRGQVYGTSAIALDDLRAMYQTAYVLLRDTGRRPTEIAALSRDCLEHAGGEVSLLWDNRKSRRLRRRLPITADTAQAIRVWQARRDQLTGPARGDRFLFPALTPDSRDDHLSSAAIGTAIRVWADGLPELLGEDIDAAGNRLAFDRSRIYPYAFRHSYAQRHADAGTPIDVLRELMDHVSIATTAGYYTVSIKRRREAVTTLSAHVMDRRGDQAPCTTAAYQMRSVAVPYGGCTEPSNIKAGGRACPIRFQCAGCGFYRPDPSYLTAIEQHINDLRAGRETAQAMEAADFVTAAMTEEINAYNAVAATMRTRLAELPAAERAEIEQASTVLRKIRAGAGAVPLPLTVINRGEAHDSGDSQ
jgi:integrase